MKDRLFVRDYLEKFCDELEPLEFYRLVFPAGVLEEKGQQIQGKYNAIAVELLPQAEPVLQGSDGTPRRQQARHYIINDDLLLLDEILKSDNFTIISPISYAGRSRAGVNARFIFGIAIDVDGITEEQHLRDLFHQFEVDYLPTPTCIVWSGSGVHLYYLLVQPLPCYKNVMAALFRLKTELTRKIWNGYITELDDKVQIGSINQGFRAVGSITKGGNRTKAFLTGERVSVEYLNAFTFEPQKNLLDYIYDSNKAALSLEAAAVKYPEWYKRRIIDGKPRSYWRANRAVYEWWKRRIAEVKVGHRYYCVMALVVYAKKCGISYEELSDDAFELVERLDRLTDDENNHFTREDVLSALEMYNDDYITFPIDTITKLTDIAIQKNKRNFRPQAVHLARIRQLRDFDFPDGSWMNKDGRPKGSKNKHCKRDTVVQWKKENPGKTIKDCIAETKLSQRTVYRYWKV